MAVKTDGTLWSWGMNAFGQLGLNNYTYYSSPKQVGGLTNWLSVAGGKYAHSVALKNNGTLWGWGRNYIGMLGLGGTTQYISPVQVGALTNWSSIDAGRSHSVAIKTDGTMWAWGGNGSGRLGLGDTTNRSSPTQIGSSTNWSKIDAVGTFTLAISY
jgi:alpha-tubulin suppressor-like RCC1 family protein